MPTAKPRKIPAYRLHKPTGYGVVRLDGRDIYLGKHGTPDSLIKYERTIAEWLASGVVVSRGSPARATEGDNPLTIAEMLLGYWRYAQGYYGDSGEIGNVKAALRPLRELYGITPARDFGPLALRAVRERMIVAGLARPTINARIFRIRRAFTWAVSHQMVPGSVLVSIKCVEPLKAGRTTAREPSPVVPVARDVVEKTLPFLNSQVAGLVKFQLFTGCRPGEAAMLRWCDITIGPRFWVYSPPKHKNAWRNQVREIVIGPRCQALLQSFSKLNPTDYIFNPREAVASQHAERATKRKSKPTPSGKAKRKSKPGANHSGAYDRTSYRNAVNRACAKAFPHPVLSKIAKNDLSPEQVGELKAWHMASRWHPHQIRHLIATEVRTEHGLEASATVLGHSTVSTAQIYAASDQAKAKAIIESFG